MQNLVILTFNSDFEDENLEKPDPSTCFVH